MPEDTRLNVTLMDLQMRLKHKWTDVSFDESLTFWHERLPNGNMCPTSTEDAKKIMCPLDLPHEKCHVCMNDCTIYRDEEYEIPCLHARTVAPLNTRKGRRLLEKWYGTFQSLFVYNVTSHPTKEKLMRWHAEIKKSEDDLEKEKMHIYPSDGS
jgi:hypothetical protein